MTERMYERRVRARRRLGLWLWMAAVVGFVASWWALAPAAEGQPMPDSVVRGAVEVPGSGARALLNAMPGERIMAVVVVPASASPTGERFVVEAEGPAILTPYNLGERGAPPLWRAHLEAERLEIDGDAHVAPRRFPQYAQGDRSQVEGPAIEADVAVVQFEAAGGRAEPPRMMGSGELLSYAWWETPFVVPPETEQPAPLRTLWLRVRAQHVWSMDPTGNPDLSGDGRVDAADMAILVGAWGDVETGEGGGR